MKQYSVIITVFAVSLLIAHSLCFRIAEEDSDWESDAQPEGRQMADNIYVFNNSTPPTTRAPLPQRIRDTLVNSIRDFGNGVRQAPVRIQECFQNISRCAQNILRRNNTNTQSAPAGPLFQLPQSAEPPKE